MGRPKIWSVGSGKGGVGKSFVASSLGLTLAKSGQRTLLVDLDLSGPNLHTALGEKTHPRNLDLYFANKAPLSDLIVPTKYPNLSLIHGVSDPGDQPIDILGRLFADARKLPFEIVVVDLSPGSQGSQLELLKLADEKLLIVAPEPSSIEKNYRLIENYIAHVLSGNDPAKKNVLKEVFGLFRSESKPTPENFRRFLQKKMGLTWDPETPLGHKPLRILVNQARSEGDFRLGYGIRLVCQHYYGMKMQMMGTIAYDNAVWQSFRSASPMLYENPFSPVSGQFHSLTREILNSELSAFPFKAVL